MLFFPHQLWPAAFMPRGLFPDDARRYEVMRLVGDGDDVTAAVISPGTTQATLTGPDASDEQYYVRVYSRCNLPDRDPIRIDLKRVAFDADGVLILPAPPAPLGLSLVPGPGGLVTAQWDQPTRRNLPAAASFNLYVATGVASIDFAASTHPGAGSGGGRPITQSLGTFAHGTAVNAVVRAVSAQGVEEANTTTATVIADAQAPDAVAGITLEVTPQ